VQARFTGHFRFACKAFVNFMSDPTNAAAGSSGPASAFTNPDDYGSRWDRNFIAMAAVLYAESYAAETGYHFRPDVEDFWKLNCIEPALERSAVPTNLWRNDDGVYGERDVFAHEVPLSEFAPLRTFGSLRQVRDALTGGNDPAEFPEDYVNSDAVVGSGDFANDRAQRPKRSVQTLYREVLCNPAYKYTVAEAVGEPPLSTKPDITDASSMRQKSWDMRVPSAKLGRSAVYERPDRGCGVGIPPSGCNPAGRPNYDESSLWAWVYVTSSHDETLAPGWHRLAHAKIFTEAACDANYNQPCHSMRETQAPGVLKSHPYDFGAYIALLHASKNNMGVTLHAPSRRRADGAGRRLYMSADGVLDADALVRNIYNSFDGLTPQTAISKWLDSNTLATPYIVTRLNLDGKERAPTSFRTGRDALFASRCSTVLKSHFKENGNVHACEPENSPPVQYASRGALCVQTALQLDNAEEDTVDAEYIGRLFDPNPPPRPPPSPSPPPSPAPPHPPRPPPPPAAISREEATKMVVEMQRHFCYSVRTSAPIPAPTPAPIPAPALAR
jgi:hypothetical protein